MKSPLGRVLLAAFTLAALVGGTAGAPAAQAQQNPYERGPDPTESLIESPRGPFSVSEIGVPSFVGGFGGGRIYYPTSTSEGTFGAVAISPGYTASWSSLDWLGPRLASHGFVVIGIETNSRYDFPASRGRQLLAALDYVRGSSSVSNRVDGSRLAVAGHSMGGGGSLEAASDRPSLEAAVPIAPWNSDKTWSEVSTPAMIITGESDSIAPPSSHGSVFYNSLGANEKSYMELNNASHFFPQSANTTMAKYMISWLKRFVDNDTRYERFLCPAPNDVQIEEYRETCPHT